MGSLQEIAVSSEEHLAGWRELVVLTLDEGGMICDCSNSCEERFGYGHRELVRQHVSKLLPQLSEIKLVKNGQLNPRLDFLCHCGHLFQTQNRQGNTFQSELHFVHLNTEKRTIRLIVHCSDKTES